MNGKIFKPNSGEHIEIVKLEIPKEIEEIIRQYGIIVETYKHIVETWTHPPIFITSKEGKE